MFKGFHHIGLRVADMERSLQFYTDGLGGKLYDTFSSPSTGATINMVELAPGAVVELLPTGDSESESHPRWAHIALHAEDVQAAYDMALQAGATPRTPPRESDLGDRSFHVAFVFGPDQELIEFFKVVPK
ncbi:MAG: VOC family protein [Symbiobacteriaceae bacterium]|nr:VOC family protein [Symbiobacteriaceae bacterium]